MKVFILIALVAMAAASRPLQYDEPAASLKEPMKPVSLVNRKTYIVHPTMEEKHVHGVNTLMPKEDADEQEQNEMDVTDGMEATKKETYPVDQPAENSQPKRPVQIYDPAPAAFQAMYANAPS